MFRNLFEWVPVNSSIKFHGNWWLAATQICVWIVFEFVKQYSTNKSQLIWMVWFVITWSVQPLSPQLTFGLGDMGGMTGGCQKHWEAGRPCCCGKFELDMHAQSERRTWLDHHASFDALSHVGIHLVWHQNETKHTHPMNYWTDSGSLLGLGLRLRRVWCSCKVYCKRISSLFKETSNKL